MLCLMGSVPIDYSLIDLLNHVVTSKSNYFISIRFVDKSKVSDLLLHEIVL